MDWRVLGEILLLFGWAVALLLSSTIILTWLVAG
jgi:hypothetical protein